MELSQGTILQLREDYRAARTRSAKKRLIEEAATQCGVSARTVLRKLDMKLRERSLGAGTKKSTS